VECNTQAQEIVHISNTNHKQIPGTWKKKKERNKQTKRGKEHTGKVKEEKLWQKVCSTGQATKNGN